MLVDNYTWCLYIIIIHVKDYNCSHNCDWIHVFVCITCCCFSPTSFRVAFCAEHAHRNALALQAQMRKASSGPSPEVLLSQLSGYNRMELGTLGQDSRSEANRILGRQFSRLLFIFLLFTIFKSVFVYQCSFKWDWLHMDTTEDTIHERIRNPNYFLPYCTSALVIHPLMCLTF